MEAVLHVKDGNRKRYSVMGGKTYGDLLRQLGFFEVCCPKTTDKKKAKYKLHRVKVLCVCVICNNSFKAKKEEDVCHWCKEGKIRYNEGEILARLKKEKYKAWKAENE